jgi:hypothetical protein
MYVKVNSVDVLKYVQSYDLTQGRSQPFPILRLVLSPANTVDALTTVEEGKVVEVYASGEGTFLITDIDKTDNEYHITAVHESVQLKAMTTSAYSAVAPEGVFTDLATDLGYASGDISAPATSYGDLAIPAGENAWEVIKYLADLTGRRAFFTSSEAYFIGTGSTKTITLGGSSPSVNVLGRPVVTRNNEDVINSMRVLYEMGEVTDSDATSIATHGERREERRSLTTEATTSTNTVREDAVNLASQLIIDNKDPITGISYQVNERKRDGSDNKVWEPTYDITDLGTITDNYTSTSVTAVPLERVTHHLPLYGTTYEWGRISKGIGQDMSQLSSEVADRVHNGTLGNDLSSRPVAIQVYGDQDLEGFDPDTLTGFYLGKKKDALGNDVYIWAGVNDGTEQVRMDTDGRLKAGADRVILDNKGITINAQTAFGDTEKLKWRSGTTDVVTLGAFVSGGFGSLQVNSTGAQTYTSDSGGYIVNSDFDLPSPGGPTIYIRARGNYASISLEATNDVVVSARRLDAFGTTNGVRVPVRSTSPPNPQPGDILIRDRGSSYSGRDRYQLVFGYSTSGWIRIDSAVTATISSW